VAVLLILSVSSPLIVGVTVGIVRGKKTVCGLMFSVMSVMLNFRGLSLL